MGSIIIYSETCMCSSVESKAKSQVKQLAHALGLKLEVRRVGYSEQWKLESEQVSRLPVPFVYNPESGQSVPLGGNISALI